MSLLNDTLCITDSDRVNTFLYFLAFVMNSQLKLRVFPSNFLVGNLSVTNQFLINQKSLELAGHVKFHFQEIRCKILYFSRCMWTSCESHSHSRSSHPEVFLGKRVLKICSKFTGEYPYWSVIWIKLLYGNRTLWFE